MELLLLEGTYGVWEFWSERDWQKFNEWMVAFDLNQEFQEGSFPVLLKYFDKLLKESKKKLKKREQHLLICLSTFRS